jgi:hypothetical protein
MGNSRISVSFTPTFTAARTVSAIIFPANRIFQDAVSLDSQKPDREASLSGRGQ